MAQYAASCHGGFDLALLFRRRYLLYAACPCLVLSNVVKGCEGCLASSDDLVGISGLCKCLVTAHGPMRKLVHLRLRHLWALLFLVLLYPD